MNRLITAGCVLALGLSLPIQAADDKDNPAVKKLDRNIPRHQDFLKRIEQSKGAGDVIFLGDSITHGWEGQKAWQEHFGSFNPVNLGISGDQTGHVLWRITDGHELDTLKPKAAVIMIGTNNTGGHTAEQIAGGIEAIVKEVRKQKPGAKVLLLAIFPRSEKPDAPQRAKIKQINDIIAKLDDGKAVFFKDIGPGFLDPKGGLPGEVMPDYLHLSPKGYDLWGKAIKADLEKLVK